MDLNNKHWQIIQRLQDEQNLSLGGEIEKLARDDGDKTALIFEDEKITYFLFNAGANRYASCFARLGFRKGDVAALIMKNRPEYLMAVTGLSKLGVITALVDIGLRGEVLAHDINLGEARAVIVGEELLEVFAEVEPRLRLRSPALILVDGREMKHKLPDRMQYLKPMLQSCTETNPPTTETISSEDVLVYMYTAGNNGLRKAVAISQQRWLIKGHFFCLLGHMNADTVQYLCLPLHYNSGLAGAFSGMIISGSTMVLKQEFSVHRLWDELRACGANYMISVGEMGRYLYKKPEREDDQNNPLEVMICNGMWGELMEPFRQRFGLKHIIEVYAKTEGPGYFINHEEIPNFCGNLSLLGVRQGEIVKYDFGAMAIKRDESGKAIKCIPGETGLLICAINRLNRFNGYINDPEATEKVLLYNVFQEGDQYFSSGDLMQLHEQDYISYVDRLGDTYRWKGRTVSANQVADVIKRFFGGIEDVVVYGVQVPGTEGRCGMAAMQLLEGENLDWSDFMLYINRRMPEHARPVFIRIVSQLEGDQSSEELKQTLRTEGFNPNNIKDTLLFLDPQDDKYVPLTEEIYRQLLNQEIKL